MEVQGMQDSSECDASTITFQDQMRRLDRGIHGFRLNTQADAMNPTHQGRTARKGPRKPTFPPSRLNWEEHRQYFAQLYQVEERPLKEVMEIMEDRWQFRATRKMYKTKITEWHLEKNYKASEKQAVLDLLEEVEPAAIRDICIEIRGRPAKMDRIFRYSRARGIERFYFSEDQEAYAASDPSSCQAQTVQGRLERPVQGQHLLRAIQGTRKADLIRSLSPPEYPSPSLAAAQDLQDAEQILLESNQYYLLHFDPESMFSKAALFRSQPFFSQSLLTGIVHTYSCAREEAAASNYERARILLNRTHRQFHLALTAEHAQLLGMVFTIVSSRSANPNFETAELFGRFAADISCAVHGARHPITKVIQQFCRMSVQKSELAHFKRQFRRMRLDTARALLGDNGFATINLRFAEGEELTGSEECNNLYAAELQCSALHDWAEFYPQLCATEQDLREVLVRDAWNHNRLRALKALAMIAERKKRWTEGECLCREALSISADKLGPCHHYTKTLAEWLLDLMSRRREDAKTEQLSLLYGLEVENGL